MNNFPVFSAISYNKCNIYQHLPVWWKIWPLKHDYFIKTKTKIQITGKKF